MSRSALVTGGGTGIGAAVARRLAEDGFRVAVAGRRPEPLEAVAADTGGVALAGDMAQEDEVARVVGAAVEELGGLDALVCAAGTGASGTVAEQTLDRWDRVLSTNLTGPFLAARAALPHLAERGGAIVMVSSLGGLRAAHASAAYASSKAGLIMLTQCIALDHGPQGVRANCVCPGWIRTEMADRAMASLDDDLDVAYARANRTNPLGRPGVADEVASAVAWLVSPEASYVNGAVLRIDGGIGSVDPASLELAP